VLEGSAGYQSGAQLASLPATPPNGTVTVRAFFATTSPPGVASGFYQWVGMADYWVALPANVLTVKGDDADAAAQADACIGAAVALADKTEYLSPAEQAKLAAMVPPTVSNDYVRVDQDYPTPGNLAYTTAQGAGVVDGVVQAILQSDWSAGRYNAVVAATRTVAGGAWSDALMLPAGTYVLQFFKPSCYNPTTVTIVVE
jgi:hypothetical protein